MLGGAEIAVVHSSLLDRGSLLKEEKWELLSGLQSLANSGVTIAIPNFTFSFFRGEPFRLFSSPSETGVLGNWLLDLDAASRTHHPVYSFSLIGPLVKNLKNADVSMCFGKNTIFDYFHQRNTRIMMLGCDWRYCSQFHQYEKEFGVPYRYSKNFRGMADYGDGLVPVETEMFVRNSQSLSYDVRRAVDPLRSRGLLRLGNVGGSQAEVVNCGDFASSCISLLRKDPYYFIEGEGLPRVSKEDLPAKTNKKEIKISIVGNRNTTLLAGQFSKRLCSLLSDFNVNVYHSDFGLRSKEITYLGSVLNQRHSDITWFVDRLEDVLGVDSFIELDDDSGVLGQVTEYVTEILGYLERTNGRIIVNSFFKSQLPLPGNQEWINKDPEQSLVSKCNNILLSSLANHETVNVFNMEEAILRFDGGGVHDARLWYVGKFIYSDQFTAFIVERCISILLAHLGKNIRVLVVDLDNTVWGGVLGEEGYKNILVGGDYPGNAFKAFQQTLVALKNVGVALAVASKNDNDNVSLAIGKISDMVLSLDDFVSVKINWKPKWQNILEISEELNIGLEHIGFVDDNPVERDAIAKHLPEVKVFNLLILFFINNS